MQQVYPVVSVEEEAAPARKRRQQRGQSHLLQCRMRQGLLGSHDHVDQPFNIMASLAAGEDLSVSRIDGGEVGVYGLPKRKVLTSLRVNGVNMNTKRAVMHHTIIGQ